jgi:hypothetical protein
MTVAESFRDKTFVVADPDARIREAGDLAALTTATVPKGARVRIAEVRVLETGNKSSIVFGRAVSEDGATEFGWTSTRNLDGKFVNETLWAVPPENGAGRFGPNAAWSKGAYLGQVELVAIVDAKLEIERLALNTIEPYVALVAAGAADGVLVAINSGFRSYPEQKLLWEGFSKGIPGFNRAAKPGGSNHQNGIAFDIAVPGGDGNPTYEWLKKHATGFGFVRTVSKEPWHWEYDPPRAEAAKRGGTFRTPGVNP